MEAYILDQITLQFPEVELYKGYLVDRKLALIYALYPGMASKYDKIHTWYKLG